MDNALRVRGFQGAADLLDYGDGFPRGKFTMLAKHTAEVVSLHKFHCDELRAVGLA